MGAIWKTGNFAWAQNWNEVEDGCKNSDYKKRTTVGEFIAGLFKPIIKVH